jgi:hypothetical protein
MTHLRGCLRHVCLVTLACAASGVAGCGPSARGGGAAPVETTPVTPAAVASSAGATGTPGAAAVTPPLSPLPFGGERFGFVEASSANGRYVALRRFAGSGEPQFGHHGEVMNGSELVMVDLVDLSERPFDEVIDVAPGRRFFLLITDNVPVLLDSATGTYEPLADADTRPDGNTCLGPRQASFSATGLRVGWVVGQATALRVRDLASGEEWSVAAATPLWRGWPDDEGRGAVLAEVPAGSAVGATASPRRTGSTAGAAPASR